MLDEVNGCMGSDRTNKMRNDLLRWVPSDRNDSPATSGAGREGSLRRKRDRCVEGHRRGVGEPLPFAALRAGSAARRLKVATLANEARSQYGSGLPEPSSGQAPKKKPCVGKTADALENGKEKAVLHG